MPSLFEFGAYTNGILPVWVMLPGLLAEQHKKQPATHQKQASLKKGMRLWRRLEKSDSVQQHHSSLETDSGLNQGQKQQQKGEMQPEKCDSGQQQEGSLTTDSVMIQSQEKQQQDEQNDPRKLKNGTGGHWWADF
ncbi:hypothetical protein M9H77_25450 [Catharanthus roseus]|uniref:Uncharacterized protein n=1 Tax=Catharanthus roseus TaxID=4058 RepID=A0ACC0A9L6_CATRO|nr:hypothetical protein M9H77_25450 [Catharanthus roseus]